MIWMRWAAVSLAISVVGCEPKNEDCEPGTDCACNGMGSCVRTCTGAACSFRCGASGSCRFVCPEGDCQAINEGSGSMQMLCSGGGVPSASDGQRQHGRQVSWAAMLAELCGDWSLYDCSVPDGVQAGLPWCWSVCLSAGMWRLSGVGCPSA